MVQLPTDLQYFMQSCGMTCLSYTRRLQACSCAEPYNSPLDGNFHGRDVHLAFGILELLRHLNIDHPCGSHSNYDFEI